VRGASVANVGVAYLANLNKMAMLYNKKPRLQGGPGLPPTSPAYKAARAVSLAGRKNRPEFWRFQKKKPGGVTKPGFGVP
jgi:hypothetical protein